MQYCLFIEIPVCRTQTRTEVQVQVMGSSRLGVIPELEKVQILPVLSTPYIFNTGSYFLNILSLYLTSLHAFPKSSLVHITLDMTKKQLKTNLKTLTMKQDRQEMETGLEFYLAVHRKS